MPIEPIDPFKLTSGDSSQVSPGHSDAQLMLAEALDDASRPLAADGRSGPPAEEALALYRRALNLRCCRRRRRHRCCTTLCQRGLLVGEGGREGGWDAS